MLCRSSTQQFIVVTQKKGSQSAHLVSVPVLLTIEKQETIAKVQDAFMRCLKPLEEDSPAESVLRIPMKETNETGSSFDGPYLEDDHTFGDEKFMEAEVDIQGVGVYPTSSSLIFVEVYWGEAPLRKYGGLDALHNPVAGSNQGGASPETDNLTLKECVKRYLQPEVLKGDDMWYCPRCKEHVEARKTLQLWSLPQVLIIHLKRFSYSRYRRDKLDVDVDFPIQSLDLSEYLPEGSVDRNAQYDLFAISNHYGGLGGGHYTAHVKNCDSHWYLYDDSHVTKAQEADLNKSAAYVLLYRRRDPMQVGRLHHNYSSMKRNMS